MSTLTDTLNDAAARYGKALDAKPSKGEWSEAGIAALTDSVCDVPELLRIIGELLPGAPETT